MFIAENKEISFQSETNKEEEDHIIYNVSCSRIDLVLFCDIYKKNYVCAVLFMT